jgi:hypothetical protein
MDSDKKQLIEKLQTGNNILVTVSRNPSVDQLSALLGLTLALNKTGKHAAAVFSGEVPSTLEFLQPEATIEKNTDSLRDFIIALDKAKADKLRYKVEDNVVRIFITPYKTSITDADLEFSQGDFNVDVVVAIGVQQQEDLDEAITAHGRILHDATVTSINVLNGQSEGLGSVNWHNDQASSLCELVSELIKEMDEKLIDAQIATALLTGIVAETERFSNEKTSAPTMTMSALLMAAGANQQLVATKLQEPEVVPEPVEPEQPEQSQGDHSADQGNSKDDESHEEPPKPNDGSLEINHDHDPGPEAEPEIELPAPEPEETPAEEPQVESDESKEDAPAGDFLSEGSKIMVDPPILGGRLTANNMPEALDPSTDPMSESNEERSPMLSRNSDANKEPLPTPEVEHPKEQSAPEPPTPEPAQALTPPPTDWTPPAPELEHPKEQSAQDKVPVPETPAKEDHDHQTLAEIEAAVAAPDVGDARDEVSKALSSSAAVLPTAPIAALNAQPLGDSLHAAEVAVAESEAAATAPAPQNIGGYTPIEDLLKESNEPLTIPHPVVNDPNAPPPVPPPFNLPFSQPPSAPQQ